MNELDYNDYLTALSNLDYSAGYLDLSLAGIDLDIDDYLNGGEV